jgi:hypothetical protein
MEHCIEETRSGWLRDGYLQGSKSKQLCYPRDIPQRTVDVDSNSGKLRPSVALLSREWAAPQKHQ